MSAYGLIGCKMLLLVNNSQTRQSPARPVHENLSRKVINTNP